MAVDIGIFEAETNLCLLPFHVNSRERQTDASKELTPWLRILRNNVKPLEKFALNLTVIQQTLWL